MMRQSKGWPRKRGRLAPAGGKYVSQVKGYRSLDFRARSRDGQNAGYGCLGIWSRRSFFKYVLHVLDDGGLVAPVEWRESEFQRISLAIVYCLEIGAGFHE